MNQTKTTLVTVIERNSTLTHRGITFIRDRNKEEVISYQELFLSAQALLGLLQQMGLKKGSELILYLPDSKMFILSFWACMLGGIIAIPLSVGMTDRFKKKLFNIWRKLKYPYVISDAETIASITDDNITSDEILMVKEIKRKTVIFPSGSHCASPQRSTINPQDIAFIQFSSGSTGSPKGVTLTHANLLANMKAISSGTRLTLHDRCLNWMPLNHDFGLIGQHLTMMMEGMDQYQMPPSLFIRRPGLWIEKASQHRATILSSPNFGFRHFLTNISCCRTADLDLSSVRAIYNGAEPISVDLCRQFLRALSFYGLKSSSMFTVYGMAEPTLAVAFPPVEKDFSWVTVDRNYLSVKDLVVELEDETSDNAVVLADVGYPVNNCRFRICSDDDVELRENTVGHIQLFGESVTYGYYNDLENTEKLFTSDGWLRTGDIGFIKNGRLVIVGRAKEVIFVNGQNLYPHDIESMVTEIQELHFREIAVCGVQNQKEILDEIIIFVLYKAELIEFMKYVSIIKRYVSGKYGIDVKHVIPVRTIPKTTSGKIKRLSLAKSYSSGEFNTVISNMASLAKQRFQNGSGEVEDMDSIKSKIKTICMEVLDIADIDENENILELAGSSLNLLQIYHRILESFPRRFDLEILLRNNSIAALSVQLSKADSLVFLSGMVETPRLQAKLCYILSLCDIID